MSRDRKQKNKEKEIKVKWIYKPSKENTFLLFQVLKILIPKEDIRNYLLKKNHNDQT